MNNSGTDEDKQSCSNPQLVSLGLVSVRGSFFLSRSDDYNIKGIELGNGALDVNHEKVIFV